MQGLSTLAGIAFLRRAEERLLPNFIGGASLPTTGASVVTIFSGASPDEHSTDDKGAVIPVFSGESGGTLATTSGCRLDKESYCTKSGCTTLVPF